MAHDSVFAPRYSKGRALVIGINNYAKVSPLGFATNDAAAVASHLSGRLGFAPEDVCLLRDAEATRAAIMSAFMRLVKADPNDRVVVFFAGHGYTRSARRGEIGYLVPHDGDTADLSTLIRWDDLTRNADLVPAKHLLFIMDACYGGLALMRALPPGSSRFLRDMLARYARQVLTAGKADEVVADAGGPREGHSVFTGHLLDAVEGAARTEDGVITANAVMSYVYERVSKDQYSRQTPHYGFIDGDGDFVFEAPVLEGLLEDAEHGADILVEVPAAGRETPAASERPPFTDQVKEYLSEQRFRIKLDDLANEELRRFHQATSDHLFPLATAEPPAAESFAERLRQYERASERLACLALLTAHWGTAEQRTGLGKIAGRMMENAEPAGGKVVWIGLRWYPALLVLYAAGISAIASHSYENLAALLLGRVASNRTGQGDSTVLESTVDGLEDVMRQEAFKWLPGHERQYTPRSEYLFKVVQPWLDDLLFLGRTFEPLFDRFEVFMGLVYADLRRERYPTRHIWGPVGRFGWKANRGYGSNPLSELLAEAAGAKEGWAPLRAGFFGGSYERFQAVADGYRGLINQLPWF
jgi:hypothetical protein